jgi:cytoplasmic iron level regulating protein YaaA (DUF328/UPF0246 family)
MKINTEFDFKQMPSFLEKIKNLKSYLESLSYSEAKQLWKCNDKIATENYENIAKMNLSKNLTPAILAYEGIQYQYMAPMVFDYGQLDYIEKNLYILSGFYGLLNAFDGIVPYRLEMQAEVRLSGYKNLYDFWGDDLYQQLYKDTEIVLNLASKEYSKCIEKYLTSQKQLITCTFGEYVSGKITTKGTYAKMARGEMVRYMAERKIESVEEIKEFDRLGYQYCQEESNYNNIVFIKHKGGNGKC